MSAGDDNTIVHIHSVSSEDVSRFVRDNASRVRDAFKDQRRSAPPVVQDDPVAEALLAFREAALVVADCRERRDAVNAMQKELQERSAQLGDELGAAHVALSKASNRLGEVITGGLFKARSVFL